MHLLEVYKPSPIQAHAVVIDPLTSLIGQGNQLDATMLTRMIDLLKSKGITGFFTSLRLQPPKMPRAAKWRLVPHRHVDRQRELEENEGRRRVRGRHCQVSRHGALERHSQIDPE
jgi:hypothetical protein